MSDDMLSQEEIDALLRQNQIDDEGNLVNINSYLSPLEQDALGEIGNISFGSAATALSTLLGQKVDITTPEVSAILRDKLEEEFPQPHVAIHVEYTDGFNGINLLVIKMEDAQIIADLMLGGDGQSPNIELNEMALSAVQEAMNQMMGSAATSMSTIFNRFINISPPGIDIIDFVNNKGSQFSEDVLIKIAFNLRVGDLIDSKIMQLLPVSFAKEMVVKLLGEEIPSQQQEVQTEYEATSQSQQSQLYSQPQPHVPNQRQKTQSAYSQTQPKQPEAPVHQPQHLGGWGESQVPLRETNVQPVQFSPLKMDSHSQFDDKNLNLLLDIPLQVTVELGRTKKQIKEILELAPGSIVELDKLAGEPVDILVNNKLIAKGEVVVIDENFGVRVTDIISQWDRVQKLQ
ncbi:flagellar motor switch phosphatase FliY [Microaerobacter geothermalis]|uniref:flagellar motor switch phosphatase FliY n=1 Tax=Microaerobacter geothermalis TaxID=674972 RepID=UPI001F180CFD|nr:flagellar motor switch phosphatase FliY [Microaerobacter geothermalis]MCF6093827.1 flagellar motor switch phosphatase FliY [Microaerobacter geothermalis]